MRRFLLASLILLALTRAAEAGERTVRGRVLDETGCGVEGVDVAVAWTADARGLRPLEGVRTDADGRFSMAFPFIGEALTVLAYDASRAHGAVMTVEPAEFARAHDMTLAGTVKIHGELSVEKGKYYPAEAVCWLETDPRSACLVRIEPEKGSFAVAAPPGKFVFTALATGHQPRSAVLPLSTARPDVPLGKIDLADWKGRVPAGSIAPTLGETAGAPQLDALLKARQFPDRWTLCYFWDHT